jgi:hypothetical protein
MPAVDQTRQQNPPSSVAGSVARKRGVTVTGWPLKGAQQPGSVSLTRCPRGTSEPTFEFCRRFPGVCSALAA